MYYLSGYVKAFHIHGDGDPYLLYYEDNGLRAIYVYMRRKTALEGVFDSVTPYGYGGVLFEGDTLEANLQAFWDVYLEKFRITYEVVKTYNEKIGVGGYGIRMDYGGDARIELYKHWKDVAPVPDFISIMFYGYERGVGGLDTTARRSTDDGIFLRFLKRIPTDV